MVGAYVASPWLRGQNTTPAVAGPKELHSYRDVVKKVLPAVVSIESKVKPAVRTKQPARGRPNLEGVPEEFRPFFEGMDPADAPERGPQGGFGSGVLVDPRGVVLTNNHVIAGADEVVVTLSDGRKFTTRDVKGDPKTDLAIVRFDSKAALPFLELGDSDQMEIGDRVLAIGAPFGLTGSVTSGIISAKGRAGVSQNMYEDFLQTDAAINPGNSGGPLVSLDAKVIGINSAIKTRSGGFQGVGLAVASNLAKTVMASLVKDGVVKRGYLGVQIKDLTDRELASRLGLKDDQNGVLVSHVYDKAPAGKAGVLAGDVIVSIAGKSIKDGRELQRVVASLPLGKPADMGVVRDGKLMTMQLTVEEQPDEFGTARVPVPRLPKRDRSSTSLDKLGMEVTDLTPEMAEQLGFKESIDGVAVVQVDPDGTAASAGLKRGTVITRVDREPVKSAAAMKEMIEKGSLDKGILFQTVSPQGGTGYVLLRKMEPAASR